MKHLIRKYRPLLTLLVGSRMRNQHRPDSDYDYLCILPGEQQPSRWRVSDGKDNVQFTNARKFQEQLDANALHAIEVWVKYQQCRRLFKFQLQPTLFLAQYKAAKNFTALKAAKITDPLTKAKASLYDQALDNLYEHFLGDKRVAQDSDQASVGSG